MGRRLIAFPPGGVLGVALVLAAGCSSSSAPTPIPTEGSYAVGVWDAGPVAAAGFSVPTTVYFPSDAPRPGAPVAVVHGFQSSAAYHVKLGRMLASFGLVAVVPSFPDQLQPVPTVEHARAVIALLDWAAAQSAVGDSPLANKVDGAVYGAIGHSYGGQVIFWSGQLDSRIRALVGLDSVAPLAGGDLSVSADFAGPSLHLRSEQANCMGGSRVGFDTAPAPKLLATVSGSSHCDVLDPPLPVCERGCGGTAWSADRSLVYHRYATAWVVCLLGHEGNLMQPYLDGAALRSDETEGRLAGVEHEGLDRVVCQR